MNTKLAVGFLILVLGVAAVGGYMGWKQHQLALQIVNQNNTELASPTTEAAPSAPSLTKEMILNGIFSPTTKFAGSNLELTYKDGHANLPVEYEQDSSESNIDKDFILINDLDKDGTPEAIFLLNDSYYNVGGSTIQRWQTLNIAHKNEAKFSILDQATIEQATVGEGTGEGLATIKSLTETNGVIALDVQRETGCANLPAREILQRYKFANGKLMRLDQKEQEEHPEITLVSPKPGDVWKIGEPHKIIFSQPWPFEENCNNLIEIDPTETSNFPYANLSGSNGAVILLKKGISDYTWDTEHAFGHSADENGALYDKNGAYIKDSGVFSLAPGMYILHIESFIGDEDGYVGIYSEPFQLVK
jgi:hypothetical protein